MKLGFGLPTHHRVASRDAVMQVARRAEELGYESLWTWDRLLYPVNPQTPYPGTPDGSMPDAMKGVMDPLTALTFAAAITEKIRLGVSVIAMGLIDPVTTARRVATMDILSNGRIDLGLGSGWSKDEHDATGVAFSTRGKRADEFLDVLKRIWTEDEFEYNGEFFTVPKSRMDVKPVQKPHPPIYMAAYAPASMQRTAAHADGWNPVGVPLAGMKEMFAGMKQMRQAAGRSDDLMISVRANFLISDDPMPEDQRFPYMGSLEQIKADYDATKELGAHEIFFDPAFSAQGATLDGYLKAMEQIKELVG